MLGCLPENVDVEQRYDSDEVHERMQIRTELPVWMVQTIRDMGRDVGRFLEQLAWMEFAVDQDFGEAAVDLRGGDL